MVETLLKIVICVFSVFGVYAFAHALGHMCFPNDHIRCMVFVDSPEVVEQIELHLGEAKDVASFFGKREIIAVVMEKYATNELLVFLKKKKIPVFVVSECI